MKDDFVADDFEADDDFVSDDFQPDQPARPQARQGFPGKVWDALAIPEKMSGQGLGQLAGMVPRAEPTGNLIRDVALNAPRIAAESVAEVAPGFISRESMVTGGAMKAIKPVGRILKPFGRAIAKAAESASGLEYKTPGVLTKAFNDSSLIAGRGTKQAGTLYDEMMDKGRVRKSFGRLKSPDLIDEALQAADEGTLTAEEALIARQTLDASKKSFPSYTYRKLRETFDSVAKTKSSEADAAFSRAVRSDALRQPFPVNKYGGTSIFKSALGSVAGMGPLVAMSPLAQGTAATGAGLVARRILRPLANQARNAPLLGGALRASKYLGSDSMGNPQGANESVTQGENNQSAYNTISPEIEQRQEHTTPHRILGRKRETKVLSEQDARRYLKAAKGDRNLARRLATRDGWTISQ